MLRKITLGIGVAGVSLAMLPLLAAFEAHVVNVTARIENALSVPVEPIAFGTVFPQEQLDKFLPVQLSGSFMSETRVDDVDYIIRQKPKCGVTTDNGTVLVGPTWTGHVVVSGDAQAGFTYTIDCDIDRPAGVTGGGLLPMLCPYLSKHEETTDGIAPLGENDSAGLAAFHQPFTVSSTTGVITWNDVKGHLSKLQQDTNDNWKIDLKVPCFGGFCAQDWADFVHGINPSADPAQYTQPISNEHKVFGCNLWLEVTGVSTTTQSVVTTLTVNKVVVQTNGGNNVISDFQLKIDGGNVTSGVINNVSAGAHTVAETGVSGYVATFSGDCNSSGQVTVGAGQNKVCTLTNTELPASITLLKVASGGDPTAFGLMIDGNPVSHNSSVAVSSNAPHSINETGLSGWSFSNITGNAKCPLVLGGTATLNEGEAITCTITNTAN